MAPIQNKRRRVEDEVRAPKKKIKIKKQTAYHSSSEDEQDDPATVAKVRPSTQRTRKSETEAKAAPKSILKASAPASQPDINEPELGSEDGGVGFDDELAKNTALNIKPLDDSDDEDKADDGEEIDPDIEIEEAADSSASDDSASASDLESNASTLTGANRTKSKRHDPDAFATSISKILSTKLSNSKRPDPVLSRSKSATEANETLANERLESKARAQIRAERHQAREKGRVKDVYGLETEEVDTGAAMEEEKRLKKTAQRGVVRLFNAVRASQVKAEEAMKKAREEGVVGRRQREERVDEMSKQGFLDLISQGGTK